MNLKERYSKLTEKLSIYKDDLKEATERHSICSLKLLRIEEAQVVVHKASQDATESIKNIVTEMSSEALSVLLDEPHKIKMTFDTRGKKTLTTTAELKLVNALGKETDMMKSNGGGVKDFASLLLRTSLHDCVIPKTRDVYILDEPLIYLSEDLRELGGFLLKELSEKMNIQIIMTTNMPELKEVSDKFIDVSKGY